MTSLNYYYLMILYPFQDFKIEIFNKINPPFYITGGSVINRYYFNHRYSDDLDYFVKTNNNYSKYRNIPIKALWYYSKKISIQNYKKNQQFNLCLTKGFKR